MTDLENRHYVLGLSGGIACYKSAELLRRLMEYGATVDVVMTEAATRFITTTTMQALSGRPVFHSLWDQRPSNSMAHINLTRQADAVLVAPASTSFMASLAHGLGDDLLTTLCLARGACPLLLAPAMNREMWQHPATQRNVKQLEMDGTHILGPGTGEQACGETGDGRMLEPDDLLAAVIAFHQPKLLQGKRVLVTAGPTAEAIDPVRVLTNRSSGKMGYAIARAAYEAGAQVSLISGPTALPTPYGVQRHDVVSARQMHRAVMQEVSDTDIFISVAAVADWHIRNPSSQKLKKENGSNSLSALSFVANPDILAEVARLPSAPWCVGFAAETNNLIEYAQQKRQRKNIPLMVGNLAQATLDAESVSLVLVDETGTENLPELPKSKAARHLIGAIAKRYPGQA